MKKAEKIVMQAADEEEDKKVACEEEKEDDKKEDVEEVKQEDDVEEVSPEIADLQDQIAGLRAMVDDLTAQLEQYRADAEKEEESADDKEKASLLQSRSKKSDPKLIKFLMSEPLETVRRFCNATSAPQRKIVSRSTNNDVIKESTTVDPNIDQAYLVELQTKFAKHSGKR
jgi:uncharacterized coiled-coil protein SlyX